MTDHAKNCQDPGCMPERCIHGRPMLGTCADCLDWYNAPKEERRPKGGDRVVNLVGGRTRGFVVSAQPWADCFEAMAGIARIVRAIDKRGVTWDYDEPASEPHRAAGNDGHGHRWKHPMETYSSEPAKVETTERERLADELMRTVTPQWTPFREQPYWAQAMALNLYDRAAEIFAAKAEERVKECEELRSLASRNYARALESENERDAGRAEVERLRGELIPRLQAELKQEHDSALKWAVASREQQAKASTLRGQVDELVVELKYCVCNENCTDPDHIRRRTLLARIEAERGKAGR
jgi:hypothetical protein